ncbi:hypothetical protein A9995_11870 [Erythrobacter sp. QSSC1-22B]|nr:hypothetical protein A9995_11870 [Erythrobacter sp. QSSC1-22B]
MRAAEAAAAVVSLRLGGITHKSDGEPLTLGGLFKQVSDRIELLPRGPGKDSWLKLKGFMSSINRGTRTKVAHPGVNFTEEQAERLFEQTQAFLEEAEELIRP